jgi:hypothetical protein
VNSIFTAYVLFYFCSDPRWIFRGKIFLYDKGDYESYRNILSVVDWDGIFRNDDIDIITNTITNTILDAANKTIPNRYITVKKDNPPWITTKIKKYIRRKNRIHKKAKKTNTIGQWGKFRKIRNKCNKRILNAKQNSISYDINVVVSKDSIPVNNRKEISVRFIVPFEILKLCLVPSGVLLQKYCNYA